MMSKSYFFTSLAPSRRTIHVDVDDFPNRDVAHIVHGGFCKTACGFGVALEMPRPKQKENIAVFAATSTIQLHGLCTR